ncbi:unnamed protein product, partial [Heterosigma akashiwo]
MREEVLRRMHDHPYAGHQGGRTTVHRVQSRYDWPGLAADVRRYVRECPLCQSCNRAPKAKQVYTMPIPGEPFSVMAMDFTGPLGKHATAGEKYNQILVVVDYLTRYVFLVPVKGHQSEEVVAAFYNSIIPITGLPKVVVSDHDVAFTCEPFRSYARSLGIGIHMVAQGSSKSNGLVERVISRVHNIMRKWANRDGLHGAEMKNWKQWDRYVPFLEFVLRTTHNRVIGTSPAESLMGFLPRGPGNPAVDRPGEEGAELADDTEQWAATKDAIRE